MDAAVAAPAARLQVLERVRPALGARDAVMDLQALRRAADDKEVPVPCQAPAHAVGAGSSSTCAAAFRTAPSPGQVCTCARGSAVTAKAACVRNDPIPSSHFADLAVVGVRGSP